MNNHPFNQYMKFLENNSQRAHEAFMEMLKASHPSDFVFPNPPSSVPSATGNVPPSPVTQPMDMIHPYQPDIADIKPPMKPEAAGKPVLYTSRIKAVKPCNTCSLASACATRTKHHILPECGQEVREFKKAATSSGELMVHVSKEDGVEDAVYRDGVFIGVIPKKPETNKLLKRLVSYAGQQVRVFSTLHDRQDPNSIYTNCFFEILGVVSETVTPPPPVKQKQVEEPADSGVEVEEFGEFHLPV